MSEALIVVQVTGLENLVRKCNGDVLFAEPVRDFFEKATIYTQGQVREVTPRDLGGLAGSITQEVDPAPFPMWGKVGTTYQPHYAPDMEFGTRAHFPPVSALEGWAKRHGIPAFLVARAIARRGLAPRNMFSKGLEKAESKIESYITEAMRAIEDIWNRD